MKSLAVIDVVNELAQIARRLLEGLILLEIHLLWFERFEKTFRFGIVIGVAFGRHTDPNSQFLQALGVGKAGILDSAIRMVNEPWEEVSLCDQFHSSHARSRPGIDTVTWHCTPEHSYGVCVA